jgi:hypothetical protein
MLFGSVFMRNTSLFTTWVKNVYSLCVDSAVNSVHLYTGAYFAQCGAYEKRVQPAFSTHSLDSFTPRIYTPIFAYLPLLYRWLFTVSTYPTINKMKEI